MHKSAARLGSVFFDSYTDKDTKVIVDIGSANVNGSLRESSTSPAKYVGLDFAPGEGVDIVLESAYSFPLETGMADAVVSTSCFEHSQFFWLTFLEALRILADDGVLYINAPSNGFYHRFPTDNWRFYPDAGVALEAWSRHNGGEAVLLESFINGQEDGHWNDFVAVFGKTPKATERHKSRVWPFALRATNLWSDGELKKFDHRPEDVRALWMRAFDAKGRPYTPEELEAERERRRASRGSLHRVAARVRRSLAHLRRGSGVPGGRVGRLGT